MDVFPIRLKMTRKRLKLTQEEVSKRAKTTIANISCYESGSQTPGLSMLVRLSAALDCSIDYLLGLTNNPANHQFKDSQNQKIDLFYQELTMRYSIFMENGEALTQEEVKEMFEYIEIRRFMKKRTVNQLG